ncbi:MAG: hypothetical protein HBSAPP02_30220 [Phycisphaerae bacterium]|nr:MAG: type II toxin-antitoxin system HicB family antitoxin [Planctomycetia bacterium]RIK69440.1 MAG: hypothetical protein DCC66_08725 [Planctomycetota bacterium]GJQ27990.1 MAG: hypothetical protein HBSAPP02_30220 [Phycisphaerae bacterium]
MNNGPIKIVVEKHADGYVAYPLGMKGVIVAQGDTFDDAVREIRSAIQFHVDTFGADAFGESEPIEAFIAETAVTR